MKGDFRTSSHIARLDILTKETTSLSTVFGASHPLKPLIMYENVFSAALETQLQAPFAF